ncbi:MAG: cobalt transporter [Lachnospiraceae bacterium]|nr:cobalt transporter [Lachnospiraceae bacterium]
MGQREKKQGIRYYALTEGEIRQVDEKEMEKADKKVCVMTLDNWHARTGWREVFQTWYDVDNIHYCKIESHKDFIFLAFHIPARKPGEIPIEFAIFMKKELLVILAREEKNYQVIVEIIEGITKKNLSVGEFLYYFLQAFLSEDLYFIEEMERDIAKIEENVLEGTIHQFSRRMLRMKKMIARFYHYYSQLVEMGQELLENQEDFFSESELENFQMYTDRIDRLSSETQLLREYAMQVQEVYHSEIEIRQNNVMKVLTIVTTIFLPLSLIAGWYGMNFEYMPELTSPWGYPCVIGLCVLIIFGCLMLFRKKHYW